MENKTVIWWGRFDPGYSRNRVLRGLLGDLGWRIRDFRPLLSRFAGAEASLRRIATPDLVWVPCFRQRDAAAAIAWARARGVPILFIGEHRIHGFFEGTVTRALQDTGLL